MEAKTNIIKEEIILTIKTYKRKMKNKIHFSFPFSLELLLWSKMNYIHPPSSPRLKTIAKGVLKIIK
ncbi:hypothetical protein LguiB_016456 [Lonicera macranthoides]